MVINYPVKAVYSSCQAQATAVAGRGHLSSRACSVASTSHGVVLLCWNVLPRPKDGGAKIFTWWHPGTSAHRLGTNLENGVGVTVETPQASHFAYYGKPGLCQEKSKTRNEYSVTNASNICGEPAVKLSKTCRNFVKKVSKNCQKLVENYPRSNGQNGWWRHLRWIPIVYWQITNISNHGLYFVFTAMK